jgi:hypothetical protein
MVAHKLQVLALEKRLAARPHKAAQDCGRLSARSGGVSTKDSHPGKLSVALAAGYFR